NSDRVFMLGTRDGGRVLRDRSGVSREVRAQIRGTGNQRPSGGPSRRIQRSALFESDLFKDRWCRNGRPLRALGKGSKVLTPFTIGGSHNPRLALPFLRPFRPMDEGRVPREDWLEAERIAKRVEMP